MRYFIKGVIKLVCLFLMLFIVPFLLIYDQIMIMGGADATLVSETFIDWLLDL